MSMHERAGRTKLGHCILPQRGQNKREANKMETRTLPQRRILYVLSIMGIKATRVKTFSEYGANDVN